MMTLLLGSASAEAFCGFYVSQAAEGLHADATAVTLMRKGQATVMAMENNYRGPPKDFAMVVPVPEVLEKKQVKTLDDGVFERVKKQTAPRLVEYWEQDPCPEPRPDLGGDVRAKQSAPSAPTGSAEGSGANKQKKVKVKARFTAGEYDIVILSSEESNALESWLHNHNYKIPDGAEKYFRPYVQRESYFFVAKVNVDRLTFQGETAELSPLRFHYESEDFRLPIRLGLINSSGTQDLLAFTIAKGQRYAVANRQNVRIPTNLVVGEPVKHHFPTFYDRLYTRTADQHEDAVITEYAWRAGQCDPCPVEPMSRSDFRTLGGDVIHEVGESSDASQLLPEKVEISSSAVDADVIVEKLDQLRPNATNCVRSAARTRGIEKGNLVVEFQIGPSGRIRSISIERDDFGGAGQCLGSLLFRYNFASAIGMSTRSVVTVKKTYRYEGLGRGGRRARRNRRGPHGWTITRMHYRYGKDGGGRDLVFQEAPPIYGGRGTPRGLPGENFRIPSGRRGGTDRNQFQGRYMILHEWTGEFDCSNPDRGQWGRKNRGSGSLKTGSGRPTDQSLDKSLNDLVTEGQLP
ncbi:MAG: DUF2330 domain-containing protein [Bradymonadaceae bacterium]